MIIHNFFSDVLLSVLHVFENYIFRYKPYMFDAVLNQPPSQYIKSVQFNIGNVNYQIGDYKEAGQLEFPTAIFSLVSDESAFGKAASLIRHHKLILWCIKK